MAGFSTLDCYVSPVTVWHINFIIVSKQGIALQKRNPFLARNKRISLQGYAQNIIFSIKDSITDSLSLYFHLIQPKWKMINYIIGEVIYANW